MARAIDADLLVKKILLDEVRARLNANPECDPIDIFNAWIIEEIYAAPTIEVVAKQVTMHSYWVRGLRTGYHFCYTCQGYALFNDGDIDDFKEDLSDYCPHCGAYMEQDQS